MINVPPTLFPSSPHHIVPRGRSHEPVFLGDADYLDFLNIMRTASNEAGLQIWTYALMRNHVHMIAVPEDRESISRAMVKALPEYAESFRQRHGITEDLWHRRCHSVAVQTRYLWKAVRYVERNPVRAGIVERAQDYRWSSAPWHCGMSEGDTSEGGLSEEDLLIDPGSPLKGALSDWSSWLGEPDRDPRFAYLRRKSRQLQARRQPEVIGLLERDLDRRISRKEKTRDRGKK